MKNKKYFYLQEDIPTTFQKGKMWKNIKHSLHQTRRNNFYFDIRNFSLGFGFAVTMIFFSIGLYTAISNVFQLDKPEIVKLNEAYLDIINSFEKKSLLLANFSAENVNMDEIFFDKTEQLKQIDVAIDEFISQSPKNDYSKLKQLKLNELYQIKLEILSKIIKLKEEQL